MNMFRHDRYKKELSSDDLVDFFQRRRKDGPQAHERMLSIMSHQLDIISHLPERLIKRIGNNKCCQELEKREPLFPVGKI